MGILQDLQDEKHELEMTPMIDVTFLLLIFFMCTLKFKTLEGKLSAYLPKDVGVNQQDAEPIEKVEILMRVKEQGAKLKPGTPPELFADNHTGRFQYNTLMLVEEFPALRSLPIRDLEYKIGPFSTHDIQDLRQKLERNLKDRQPTMPIDPKTGEKKKVPATIDARPGTVYEDVAMVLDVAIAAGFEEITFVGAYPDHIK
jgi:biopolymer transport protein ExbD